MEWRQQPSVSCADAFAEAQRWIQEVTGKSFGCNNFRAALENGVLLCDLINQLKPGIIKRLNRLSTPIAGLDNVNVFLKACGKLGLNESQRFHPGDLQDLSTRVTLRPDESSRRLKNVLITIYWLGRKAHQDACYSGPQLNFKAFEGLLGFALSKALDESSNVFVKDSCYPDREDCRSVGPSYNRGNSVDSVDSVESQTIYPNTQGCGSDAEAEQEFKMEAAQPSGQRNKGYVPPALLRRKHRQENGRSCGSPLGSPGVASFSRQHRLAPSPPDCTVDEDLFLRALCDEDSEDDSAEADPVLDDWYFRRVQQTLHQTSVNPSHDRFLPRYWTPEEEIRVRTIYLGSQKRPWYHKMQLLREKQNHVRARRPVQVNPGWIWSKSLSDIPMMYPVRSGPDENTAYNVDQDTEMWNQENKGASSAVPKDSEAHWHDDLKKWKSRRRSTTSDLRTKSQDREHVITQMTNGAVADFKSEPQDGLKKDHLTPRRPGPNPHTYSSPSKPLSSDLRPHTRALLSRSYATEAPFSPSAPLNPDDSHHTQASPLGAIRASDAQVLGEEAHVALASDGAGVTTPSQDCPFSSQTQVKAHVSRSAAQPASKLAQPNQVSTLITTMHPKETIKSTSTWDFTASSPRSQEESPKGSWDSAVEQGRGQQAAGVYKNWSSSASLPRGFRRSEGSSRLSSAITARPFGSKLSRMSSLKRYNVDHSDMRVSLTLKPNSRQDFGFQTRWDSTGARVKYIEPGSPAELCQLCVDDEIVAVDGVLVADMSDNQWKAKMTHALQNGSLTMDVRRYGNKDWSNGERSHHNHPGQSRMTLNLTPAASVVIGCTDHHANGAASADTVVTEVSKFNGQPENVKQGKVTDGEHGDSYRKSSKGGSESAISDLQVPSLNPSATSWTWDCEEDRRRQEKWQEEQERLLQEKYKQDQERLEAEWHKAQQDAFGDSGRKSGQDNVPAGTQPRVNGVTIKAREEWSPDKDQQKEAGSKSQTNSDCLSPAHRTKSLSTPALSGPYRQTGGDQRKGKGQSVSKAELERQQILEEMKKRTQLLTDNSWIRQRSSSFYKEPVHVGLPMKKHDSLDNLDVLHQSPGLTATYSYPRPHSAAAGYSVPSRNFTSRYSTGAIMSQRSESGEYSHHRSVWAATDDSEELRLESRFDSKTGTPTVSPAFSNSSPLLPPPRDQHAILHITE